MVQGGVFYILTCYLRPWSATWCFYLSAIFLNPRQKIPISINPPKDNCQAFVRVDFASFVDNFIFISR